MDIDTKSRVVEQQDARLGQQALAEYDFLLVAARKVAHRLQNALCLNLQVRSRMLGKRMLAFSVEQEIESQLF